MLSLHEDAPWKLNVDPKPQPLEIKIVKSERDYLEFDMIHADPSIANALRRIMLAEVESVALETIYLYMNNSVMHDEIFCHRLGLVPLNIDPEEVKLLPEEHREVRFKLHVKNTTKKDMKVLSKHLKYIPNEQHLECFERAPEPLHGDILLNILVPGEEIELEAVCAIGVGSDHAKFSPVCTAAYRAAPEIDVLPTATKDHVKNCPVGVFDIEDDKVVAKNPRKCTFCRDCLRSEIDHGVASVALRRNERHFLFTVESVGVIPAAEIFRRAIKILRRKCKAVETCLQELPEKKLRPL